MVIIISLLVHAITLNHNSTTNKNQEFTVIESPRAATTPTSEGESLFTEDK